MIPTKGGDGVSPVEKLPPFELSGGIGLPVLEIISAGIKTEKKLISFGYREVDLGIEVLEFVG